MAVSDGARLYRVRCAIRIQSYYRAHKERKKFKIIWSNHEPDDPHLKQKFLIRKLGEASDSLVSKTSSSTDEIQALFSEIDNSLHISRMTFEEVDELLKPSIDWERIKKQADHRLDDDCPICMMALLPNKPRYLTSCGHVFHERCLDSFEEFVPGRLLCPMCRTAGFSKRLLTS